METLELHVPARRSLARAGWLFCAIATGGCTSLIGDSPNGAGGAVGSSGSAGGVGSGGSATNGSCTATDPVPQRLVRLSFAQVANTIRALLGPDALKGVSLDNPRKREFQSLFVEGDLVNTQVLQKTVSWAESAVATLADPARFTQTTGCPAPIADACASKFVTAFAEKAYRRPLSNDEGGSLLKLYTDLKTGGASTEEAVRSAMEAALVSPQALYRTEFGKPGGLSDDEVASQLSYFLSDGPPDAALLAAARDGKLSTPEGIQAEVDRLLRTTPVVQNFGDAMLAYFVVGQIDSVVKDPMIFPDFTLAVRNSMYTATQKFIENNLWKGQVGDLLTARSKYVDENLAKLYGVTYPAAPGSGFVSVEFGAGQRSGILTELSILAIRARTDNTSVVSRGLYVNSNVLCNQTPPPPPATVATQVAAQKADATATEREKSDYRRTTSPCSGCHSGFDQYGLLLESFDGIGRFRAAYPDGTPIDTSVTLPDFAGGGTVADVSAFATEEASNGVYSRCLVTNMLKFALAEGPVNATDCSVKDIHDRFLASDRSFASLLRAIALSKTLSTRGPGQ